MPTLKELRAAIVEAAMTGDLDKAREIAATATEALVADAQAEAAEKAIAHDKANLEATLLESFIKACQKHKAEIDKCGGKVSFVVAVDNGELAPGKVTVGSKVTVVRSATGTGTRGQGFRNTGLSADAYVRQHGNAEDIADLDKRIADGQRKDAVAYAIATRISKR